MIDEQDDPINVLDGLTPVDEQPSVEGTMASLLDKKDIQMKTEYSKPVALTRLSVIGMVLDQMGIYDEEELNPVLLFVNEYSLNQVSKARGSRKEFTEMIKGTLQQKVNQTADAITGVR